MELLQLQYFLQTAEKENISAVAKAFFVPPSSVSASIKKLEQELGVTLFERTANSLRLSETGRIFYRAVKNAAGELERGKRELEEQTGKIGGEIHLLILTNRSLVTKRISAFKEKYPAVSFRMQHTGEAGQNDIIISDKPLGGSGFTTHPLVREELFLAVHRENPLAKEKSVSLLQLAAEKFVCMPRGTSLRDNMDAAFHRAGVSPVCAVECDDPYYVCEYVRMGLGVTFFPGISWQRQKDDRIKLLRIGDGLYRESFLYVSTRASRAAKLFADSLK